MMPHNTNAKSTTMMTRTTTPFAGFDASKWQSVLLILSLLLCGSNGLSKSNGITTNEVTEADNMVHNSKHHRREMVGAYFPADPKDPFVQEAVRFCLPQIASQKDYSFVAGLPHDFHYEMIDAQQQVVAGRNYRLVIELVSDDKTDNAKNCLGAFHITIYDHFGELSITHWGDEMTCTEATKLKEKLANENSD